MTVQEADARLDGFGAPDRTTPFWSETTFVGGWSPKTEVGIFVHAGRCRSDLDLWWAHTAVYLPDGELAVGYAWGRSTDESAIRTSNLEIAVLEPFKRWRVAYDGAGEHTTVARLAAGTVGSGRARPMRWSIDTQAAKPPWIMLDSDVAGNADDWAGDMHTQQTHRGTGTISYDGNTYDFDGPCFTDHSRGARTLTSFGGDISLIGIFDDFSIQGIQVWDGEGKTQVDAGQLFTSDGSRPARIRFPGTTDMEGNPRDVSVVVEDPEGGGLLALRAEVLRVMPITITDDNDNLNGIDWDFPGDPLALIECTVRLTTDDGRVGYGNLERSMRRSRATR